MKIPVDDLKIGLLTYYLKCRGLPKHKIRTKKDDFLVSEILDDELLHNITHKYGDANDYYTLLKMPKPWGISTIDLLIKLSRRFNIKRSIMIPLGLKDSRAMGYQYILIRGKLERGKNPYVSGYINRRKVIGKPSFKNYFMVIIHYDDASLIDLFYNDIKNEEVIVPNFFGYQRFGEPRLINHIVGKYIVERKFDDAVLAFLTLTSENEKQNYAWWRKELRDTLKFKELLKEIPKGLYYERKVLESLVNKGDYIRALRSLPISIRKMFTMAYQSYIFNLILSERIKLGISIKQAIDGDYVLRGGSIEIYTGRGDRNIPLIPLIGYAYKPSKGLQGEIERKILSELDIKPKDFYIKEMPEISIKGGFREVVQNIHFLSIIILKGRMEVSAILDKGCYMTILLREILKPQAPIKQGY